MHNINPFLETDSNRHAIWNLLVKKQNEAILGGNWNAVENDYVQDNFSFTDATGRHHPEAWLLKYANREAYGKLWTQQAEALKKKCADVELFGELYRTNLVRNIQVQGNSALAFQKLEAFSGRPFPENNLYQLSKIENQWKISGLIAHLPVEGNSTFQNKKSLPANAIQHKTAGPYSPVLQVDLNKIIVISGQAPIDMEGTVHGENIEDQTRYTLENCRKQLNVAGVDFQEVFKVNVYLTDLDLWPRFNKIYQDIMPKPFPVRTAVGTTLLYNFLVEIEMWAISNS